MAATTRRLHIPRPGDVVWRALADFGSISAWAPDVDHSSLMSDQTAGVGTVRRIQTGRLTLVERVVHWDDGAALGYVIEGLPPAVRSVTNTWRLQPSTTGTDATLTTDVDVGPRPPQQLVARALARRLAGVSDRMLAGLRDHLLDPTRSQP